MKKSRLYVTAAASAKNAASVVHGVLTEMKSEKTQRKNMSEDQYRYIHGSRPQHVHTDKDNEQWFCNSPYCIDMQTNPPDKGGPPIIYEGLEPWRGRQ